MKKIVVTIALSLAITMSFAQKYITRTGKASFFSSTPIENIEAFNNEGSCVFDPNTNSVLFVIPIKSFKFEKALMQEHFNEQYMESNKFPKAEFKGKLEGDKPVDYSKDGKFEIVAKGVLTIHGESKNVAVPGTVTVKGGKAQMNAVFKVKPADYKISIPKLMSGKIAESIEVTVNFILDKK